MRQMREPNQGFRLTVIVPTYRRPGPLAWTLTSILKQRFLKRQPDRLRLVVLNNDADKEPVARVVDEVVARVGVGRWELRLHHREPQLYALDNMYNGIVEFADEGDIAFLNGDDDLVLPDSLALRAEMLREAEDDMLLSTAQTGLFYTAGTTADTTQAYFTGGRPKTAEWREPRTVSLAGLCKESSIFMSNHVYRQTGRFRSALEQTRQLMRRIPVGGVDVQAMLPQFLPIYLIRDGGVLATETQGAMRGQYVNDVLGNRRGRMTWIRPGYYYASCLYLLHRTELAQEPDLEPMRRTYLKMVQQWAFPSRSIADFRELSRQLQLGPTYRNLEGLANWWHGVSNWLKSELRVNGLSLRRQLKREAGSTWESVFSNY